MHEKAKNICNRYSDASAHMGKYKKTLDFFGNERDLARNEIERRICEQNYEKMQEKIKEAEMDILLFKALTSELPLREQSVLEQIYGEHTKWKDVVDETGYPLSNGSVDFTLRKAYAAMEKAVSDAMVDVESLNPYGKRSVQTAGR